jgi:sigma-B regulation protein RsbU (phosphoserine phosphatase)
LVVREKVSGETKTVAENGLFLGYFPEAEYSAMEIPFREGDSVLLYTDGISEMMDPSEEQFGEKRLKLFLDENHSLSASKFADSLLDRLSLWSGRASGEDPDDDVTLLAVNFDGAEKRAER